MKQRKSRKFTFEVTMLSAITIEGKNRKEATKVFNDLCSRGEYVPDHHIYDTTVTCNEQS